MSPLEQYLSPFEQYPEIFTDLLSTELPHEWNSELTTTCNPVSENQKPIEISSNDKVTGLTPDHDYNSSVGGSPASLHAYFSPGPEPVIVSPELYNPLAASFADPVYNMPMDMNMFQSPLMEKHEDASVAMSEGGGRYQPQAPQLASPVVPLTSTPVIVVRSDTDKAKLRRARNAEAARRSRRSKSRLTELEALVEKLTADNQRLVQENLRLKTHTV